MNSRGVVFSMKEPVPLEHAEDLFSSYIALSDPEAVSLVERWQNSFCWGKSEEGNQIVEDLRRHGIEPNRLAVVRHDDFVRLGIDTAAATSVEAAAAAFVIGCNPANPSCPRGTSPLRSLSILRNLPEHRFVGDEEEHSQCRVCGEERVAEWWPMAAARDLPVVGYLGEDWEVLGHAMYLRWFNRLPAARPTQKDLAAFRRFLKAVADVPEKATARQTAGLIKKVLKGIPDWGFHMECLGFAGVLKTDEQPGNLQRWVNFGDRLESRREVPPPAVYWRRGMGFDTRVFGELFPGVRLPKVLRAD